MFKNSCIKKEILHYVEFHRLKKGVNKHQHQYYIIIAKYLKISITKATCEMKNSDFKKEKKK